MLQERAPIRAIPESFPRASFKEPKTCSKQNSGVSREKMRQTDLDACEMITSPEIWLEDRISHNRITGIIFYLGDWSFRCENYLKAFNGLQKNVMSGYDCKLYAVCSQKQKEVNKHAKKWRLGNFQSIIGDHVNSFAKYLKSEADIFPEMEIVDCNESKCAHLTKDKYPFGVAKPAVLFFIGTEPVLRWCDTSNISENGNDGPRPGPLEVWEEVTTRMEQIHHGDADLSEVMSVASCGDFKAKRCSIM